jgi:hypothetical protein
MATRRPKMTKFEGAPSPTKKINIVKGSRSRVTGGVKPKMPKRMKLTK